MTEPVRVGELLPGVLGEDVDRAGHGYDAEAHVLWSALAPELWRRTTIALHRALAREVGVGEAGLRRLVRISAKVAEFQRRGAIHFHAVIRPDAATACRCPDCLLPPPEPFAADLLEDALKAAVPAVCVPSRASARGPDRRLTGDDVEQLDRLPAHVAEPVRTARDLGGRPELERLRL